MKTQHQQVKDFMQVFGQETPSEIKMPSVEVRRLRAQLILEEAIECIEALGVKLYWKDNWLYGMLEPAFAFHEASKPNLTALVDGLCDLNYVAFHGTAIACGLSEEVMSQCFDEVHRSNMSKMWTAQEFERTYDLGTHERKYGAYCNIGPGEPLMVRVTNARGKVIKSPSFSPPNLEQFLSIPVKTESSTT